ncbi:MAG: ABC transporter permease [Gammaproteobacteria bacterium]|nr:ABC transporter permease [Gammaproteobacteria bacterium]MCP4880155.1 ABC transporter permease [Gammaproteobacteria bacterium]
MNTSSSTGGLSTVQNWKNRLPKDASIISVMIGMALLFELLGWIFVGQSFIFNYQRLLIMILQMAIIGIIAVGVTQIIIMAGIDLSSGSVLAFTGIVAASLAQTSDYARAVYPALTDMPLFVPIMAGILMGLVMGSINGGLIAYSGIPPFIATLGMLVAARGLARWYTSGSQVSFFIDDYAILGSGVMPVVIFLSVAIIFHLLLRYTRYGRYTYAIGSNEQAARVSGINIKAHKVLVYTLAGGLYGLAAVVETSRTLTAQSGAGMLYELDAIAAVVIGGTSLMGGKGRITGTIIGVCILGIITSGFTFLGIGSFYTNIVKGVIIVAAVVADQYRNKNSDSH